MAGQQFQYDDSGNTFFYFLTSFVGLIVIPATYYLWPRDQHAENPAFVALGGVEVQLDSLTFDVCEFLGRTLWMLGVVPDVTVREED
ncbi:hypothetical protein BTVI_92071 [Pitangus sulphuratus]|nr:hypothetical protein BTVI_92071 [Pitangus sulphuratus]